MRVWINVDFLLYKILNENSLRVYWCLSISISMTSIAVINPFDRLTPDHYNFLAVGATRESLIAEERYRWSVESIIMIFLSDN